MGAWQGDAWHMILGDNPVGHGFVFRDLVLIELSGHAPQAGGGLKISKSFLKGGGGEGGGGSRNFEVKIKTA